MTCGCSGVFLQEAQRLHAPLLYLAHVAGLGEKGDPAWAWGGVQQCWWC